MNLILFGFKNSGKTFLGKLLALKLGRHFIDTDAEIEKLYFQREKKAFTYHEIFQKKGEAQFRSLEREIIFSLKNQTNAVIALGGRAINEKNFSFLNQIGELFYLKASFSLIAKRMQGKRLPAFVINEKEPLKAMQKLFHEREIFFQTLKAKELSADLLEDPEKLNAAILQLQKSYGSQ